MAKTSRHRLTDLAIKKAARPLAKPLSDGGNLLLAETEAGRLKWIVRFYLGRKRRQIWLGEYPGVTLAAARDRRDEIEKQASKGIDPKQVRSAGPTAAAGDMTFAAFVTKFGPALGPPSPRANREWMAMMSGKYVASISEMAPGKITGDNIADVVAPVWTSRPPTGKKLLAGVARVLRAARGRGVIDAPHWTNPADYRASFSGVMKKPVHREKARAAMPYRGVAAFMVDLRAARGMEARALEFVVLTCVRASEATGARWQEIDREAKTWTIPAERMKGEAAKRKPHTVPLSDAALDVLDRVTPKSGKPAPAALIFPSLDSVSGEFHHHALLNLLRALRPDARDPETGMLVTVHGFRSSMFAWAMEMTDHSDRTVDAALAHSIKDKVQRSYNRSTLLEKRVLVMRDWAAFVTAATVPAANCDDAQAPAEAA